MENKRKRWRERGNKREGKEVREIKEGARERK